MRCVRQLSSRSALLMAVLGIGIAPQVSAADPPGRIGRVSYLDGSVSFRADDQNDWAAATLNYPLTTGGELWTDIRARAEVHVGSSAVRLAPETLADFVDLGDHTTRIRLTQGSLYLRVRQLESDDSYEVETPEGTVSVLEGGHYRIDVSPDGRRSTLSVRDGNAEITTGAAEALVRSGESFAVTGPNSPASVISLVAIDDWERWCQDRDHVEDESLALRYLSPGFVGFEALGGYGSWEIDGDFGPVWVPTVSVGWAPYRFGYWSWVNPWGWTWIDQAPWGFAPFHYGRWAFRRNRWAWVPGEIVPAPVYAPALVAFLGGSGFDLSVSLGAGEGVGWFPLAPGEVYVPGYRVSQTYIRSINITNVKVREIDFRNLDVARARYANRAIPGAVTAVSRENFLRGAPVARYAIRVPPTALSKATVIGATAPLPRTESATARAGHGNVSRPPATAVPVTATPSGPTAPAIRRARQTERDQVLARQAAERAALEQRQQAELRSPPAGVSPDELRQRQTQERQAMEQRHQTERDTTDRRYRGRRS
jgi:hypothetical protein